MPTRVRALIATTLLCGACSLWWAAENPSHDWVRFIVYLAAVLLSSGLKVAMPRGDGTMSLNFPFIFLGILELSPLQAIALAGLSVFAQCRIRVLKAFTLLQIAFNIGNAIAATALACFVFRAVTRSRLELAPSLAIGAVAYFFANTIPVALAIGWSKGESPVALWRRQFPWYLPFYLLGAVLAVVTHFISVHFGWLTSLLLVPVVYTIYQVYKIQVDAIRDKQKHLEETEALHLRTIEGLAMAIEAKDQNTHDHLLRVRVYVSEIGKSLGLDDQQMKALLTASYLHDIGKLAVPEHIINKPGKLTKEEFEKMKIHPVVGAEILERVRFPYPVVPIVRSHHEAWDGTGYPDGLKGEEIPIGARILTAVDCFDALASDRPYRRAMPLAEAIAFVKARAGTQFDPKVVEILESRCVELERLARTAGEELAPLNTDITIQRGDAPAAGFEENGNGAAIMPREGELELPSLAASGSAEVIFGREDDLSGLLNPADLPVILSIRLRRYIRFDSFAAYLRDGDQLLLRYVDGIGKDRFSQKGVPLGEGVSGWVAASGRAILNGNPKVEPHYVPERRGLEELNAALSVPLLDPTNEVVGVVTLYSKEPDSFSQDHLRVLVAEEPKFALALHQALLSRAADEVRAEIPVVTPHLQASAQSQNSYAEAI